MPITIRGETFAGFNRPKRTPKHPTKTKLIRFGQQGVSGAGKNPRTAAQKTRRASFKARHAANIAKGRMSAAFWADRVKW